MPETIIEMLSKYSGDNVDEQCIVRDMLTDLMHVCASEGIPFDDELEAARMNFEAEVWEETVNEYH